MKQKSLLKPRSQRERGEVLRLTASEERLLVFVILHWSNLAFDCEITLKRTIKVSSIISSKKILSQVTVSVKNGHRRVQIAQSAIISLNIVNGSLGRESALFVGVQRGERILQHLWRKQQLIHQRLATWRQKMTPMQILLMGLRMCCIKKLANKVQDDLSAYGMEMPIFGITRRREEINGKIEQSALDFDAPAR